MAEKPIHTLDTTDRTHVLFLDMLEVEHTHNVALVVNQATRCRANPVLALGDVGEWDFHRASSWAGSVIFDEDEKIFKMWYYGESNEDDFGAIGYASSQDGVYWEKPELGLYEYEGSKANNIVFQSPTGNKHLDVVCPRLSDHLTVEKDYREADPDKRYKGWTRNYHKAEDRNRFFPVYSNDGIHWRLGEHPVSYPTVDPTNLIIDDEDPDCDKRIKLFGHAHRVAQRPLRGHRDMGYGPDIEHCVPSPANPVLEVAEGMEHTIHLFATIRYRRHYVTLYHHSLWLDYYDQKGNVRRRQRDVRIPEPKTGAFVADVRLAVNRDGVGKFERVKPYQQVLARGEKGEWDGGFLVASAPIVHGDTIYIFYTGVDESGGAAPSHANQIPTPMRTGLATLRLDGFTYLQSRDRLTPATMTTVPIEVEDPQGAVLIVNASDLIPYRDWIEVEVLDAKTDTPVEGYTREACRDVIRDGIRIPVCWQDRDTLAAVRCREIKLRFTLYGRARLFSFSFAGQRP